MVGLNYFFFFFQAEDGIRDIVTGVQTCALPICSLNLTWPYNLQAGIEPGAGAPRSSALRWWRNLAGRSALPTLRWRPRTATLGRPSVAVLREIGRASGRERV